MLSKEGQGVACTGNFNCAVALATFGFPYSLERLRDESTGDMASCLWHIDPNPLLYSKSHPDEPMPSLRASTVLKQIREGTLAAADGAHPILDVLTALNIYERLRTAMERDTRYRIAITAPGRATLIEGHEPMADTPVVAIRTDSLELATALVRVGVPLLAIEGIQPHRRLVLAAHGYDLGSGPVDAKALAAAINDGSLQLSDPSHPALWAIVGLRNRKAMRAQMQRDAIPLLLRNPKSLSWAKHHKSSILHGHVDGKVIDRARQSL